MAYLMVKYEHPTTYAILDLTGEDLHAISSGLTEYLGIYTRLGAPPERLAPIEALLVALERRYDDD